MSAFRRGGDGRLAGEVGGVLVAQALDGLVVAQQRLLQLASPASVGGQVARVESASRRIGRRRSRPPGPSTAQVAITRVDVNATWLALMLRPAINRLATFLLYSDRSGMS